MQVLLTCNSCCCDHYSCPGRSDSLRPGSKSKWFETLRRSRPVIIKELYYMCTATSPLLWVQSTPIKVQTDTRRSYSQWEFLSSVFNGVSMSVQKLLEAGSLCFCTLGYPWDLELITFSAFFWHQDRPLGNVFDLNTPKKPRLKL